MEVKQVVEQVVHVGRESHRHAHIGERVLEDQIPADDPGEDFAQRGVGIGVGAAGDGDHGGQLGVTDGRESACDRHQHERQRDGRTRPQPAAERGGSAAMEHQIEHGCFEDGFG